MLKQTQEKNWRVKMATKPKFNYQGGNFDDWYKANYGTKYVGQELTRPDSMSDFDWEQGQRLKWYADKQGTIQDNYNTDVANQNKYYDALSAENNKYYAQGQQALDESKSKQQQLADVTQMRLQKYLPMQLKAQGLGGLGMSETAMLQANNYYQNKMSEVESDYSNRSSELLANYQTKENQYAQERQTALDGLLNNYRSDMNTYGDSAASLAADEIYQKYLSEYKEEQKLSDDRAYAEQQKADDRAYAEKQLADERQYQEQQKQSDREYAEQKLASDRAYAEQQLAADRAYQEGLIAKDREYESQLRQEDREYEAQQKADDRAYAEQQEDKRRQEEQAEQDKIKAEQEASQNNPNAYNEFIVQLESFTDPGKGLDFIEQNKDLLVKNGTYDILKSRYTKWVDEDKVEQEKVAKEEETVKILSGEQSFESANWKGHSYRISDTTPIKKDDDILNDDSFNKWLKSEYGYRDAHDPNIKNGTTAQVHLNDGFLGLWGHSYLITYFNGNWYHCE